MKNRKKVFLVDISYPIPNRLNKIGAFYNEEYQIIKILWDREGIAEGYNEDERVLVSDFGYGNVKSLLLNLVSFYRFLRKQILSEKPELIICRYWIPSFLCAYKKREHKLIYDVNDIPYGSRLIVKISNLFEKYVLNHADHIFLSSRFQQERYKSYLCKATLLENRVSNKLRENERIDFMEYPQNISFIGQIRYKEMLIELIEKVSNSFEINLYGKGSDSQFLETYLKANGFSNVHYFGAYKYDVIADIYQKSGFVWAVYPPEDENVQIAISNKFFECIFFERIIIVSEGTQLGNLVKKLNIGLTVDVHHLENLLDILKNCDIKEKLENIREYKKYHQNYWEDYKESIAE